MCWNEDISFNTFLFGCFVLSFIYITNTYTRYKTPTFDNPFVYLLIFAAISMQLIEHFLWKNLKNKSANQYYSKIACMVVLLQPLILMCLIPETTIRYGLIILYGILWSLYLIFIPTEIIFYTTVSKKGHLIWEWMKYKPDTFSYVYLYLLMYTIPLFFIESVLIKMFFAISLLISIFFYYKDGSFGSMWCWIINIFMLYFIINILLVQPFLEYNGLCGYPN